MKGVLTMIDLTKVVEAVIGLSVALITTFLIPWLRQRLTAGQREVLDTVIETAVLAAEQMYGSGMGKEKLKAVMDYLHAKGYDVDVEQIEAMVYALINADKATELVFDDEILEPGDNPDE